MEYNLADFNIAEYNAKAIAGGVAGGVIGAMKYWGERRSSESYSADEPLYNSGIAIGVTGVMDAQQYADGVEDIFADDPIWAASIMSSMTATQAALHKLFPVETEDDVSGVLEE